MHIVIAYESDGRCPFEELLAEVRRAGNKVGTIHARRTNLEEHGLDLLNTNMMDNIEDDIFELRAGRYRVFCFFDRPGIFVLLNGFFKRTPKTPELEKQRARDLRNEYLSKSRE